MVVISTFDVIDFGGFGDATVVFDLAFPTGFLKNLSSEVEPVIG